MNLTVSRALLVVAMLLAFVAALLGFDIFTTDGDPHILGWIAASLTAYFGSQLT